MNFFQYSRQDIILNNIGCASRGVKNCIYTFDWWIFLSLYSAATIHWFVLLLSFWIFWGWQYPRVDDSDCSKRLNKLTNDAASSKNLNTLLLLLDMLNKHFFQELSECHFWDKMNLNLVSASHHRNSQTDSRACNSFHRWFRISGVTKTTSGEWLPDPAAFLTLLFDTCERAGIRWVVLLRCHLY